MRRSGVRWTRRPTVSPLDEQRMVDSLLEFGCVAMQFGECLVFSNVSFQLATGEIAGLIGNNGAGKTTLLRLAAGMHRPSAGLIRRFGHSAERDWKRRIGALIEKPGHYDELTVHENLEFSYAFYVRDRRARSEAIQERLCLFGLEHVSRERVGRLSAGYRQRLSLARAFHPGASLVLLDEPFDGLDPTIRTEMKDTLHTLRGQGSTILMSTHGLSGIDGVCDRILVLANHRIHQFTGFAGIRRYVEQPGGDLDAVYTALIHTLEGHGS
jgi:ABC-type multidrug transport system ATPase subunit